MPNCLWDETGCLEGLDLAFHICHSFRVSCSASILFCGMLYIFVNIAYFTEMTKEEFLASPAVAITFANKAFPSLAWIAPVGVALSTLGSLNGICWGYSRS